MDTEPKWLSKEIAIALHAEQLVLYGGGEGMREVGLLESALSRPINLFNYSPNATIWEMAASLGYGIINNHPFVDGNKRTGFMAIEMFIYFNKHLFRPDKAEAVAIILSVAAGEMEEDQLARWIEVNSSPIEP